MRYIIINIENIATDDPVWARGGKVYKYYIEDTQDGYYPIGFDSLEQAKERCQEWNDDDAADELSEGNT